jgi:hypothetical protein
MRSAPASRRQASASAVSPKMAVALRPKPKNLSGSSLLKEAVNVMTNKLRRAYSWRIGIRENVQMYKVPSTIRGNDTYAYYQSARIQQIQQFLTDNLKIKYQDAKVTATNALFITLTQQYNPHEEEDIIKTWLNMRAALKKFKSRMRRLNMTDFALTLEAHASGGCHAHMIALFGDRGIGIHNRLIVQNQKGMGRRIRPPLALHLTHNSI